MPVYVCFLKWDEKKRPNTVSIYNIYEKKKKNENLNGILFFFFCEFNVYVIYWLKMNQTINRYIVSGYGGLQKWAIGDYTNVRTVSTLYTRLKVTCIQYEVSSLSFFFLGNYVVYEYMWYAWTFPLFFSNGINNLRNL